MKKLFISVIVPIAFAACSTRIETNTSADSDGNTNISNAKPKKSMEKASASPAQADKGDNAECLRIQENGNQLIASQTFEIDFEPFKGGCFVTFGDKNEMLNGEDLPRGSRFFIYKDGKKVFDFPDAFGGQSACWVEAVGFEDVTRDGKTDVIIAGKCLGAKDSYSSNAVFVNQGNTYITDDEKNIELDDLKTIKEIIAKYPTGAK